MGARSSLAGLLVLCSALPAPAAVRALLVGINDYPAPYALASPRRDVAAMRELLHTTFGMPEAAVLELLDGAVTHESLERAFHRHLIAASAPEDTVIFYFSGHGSFIHDENGDEPDGLDEVLVLHGAPAMPPVPREALLVDDELGVWLDQIRARRVFVILDACHSGTGTRAIGDGQAKFFDLGYRAAASRSPLTPALSGPVDQTETATPVVALAACRADQISWATTEGLSLFTGAMVAWLRANPAASGQEFSAHLIPQVERHSLFEYGRLQTPQLEGAWEIALNRFIAPPDAIEAAPRPIVVNPPAKPLTAPVVENPPAADGLRLSLTTSQSRYRVGERVAIELAASHDCFVNVYHTAADGVVQLIFPNAFQGDHRVPAGRAVRIPAPDAPFQFTVIPPAGTERITAYASATPLPEPPGLERAGGSLFPHAALRPGSPHLRGLRIEAAGAAAPRVVFASVEYYVEP